MKCVRLALLATAMALGAANAQATAYTTSEVIDAGESYTFENAKLTVGTNSFSDTFTFTLGSGVSSASFLFNIGLPSSPISAFSVTYDGDDITVSGGTVSQTYTTTTKSGKTLTYSLLAKAEYTFELSDLDSGATTIDVEGSFVSPVTSAKSYSLTVTAGPATAAVPEPDSLALMLAGLGLMAAVARRKSKSL